MHSPLQLSGPAHGAPTEDGTQAFALSSQYVALVQSVWLVHEARGATQVCVVSSQISGGVHCALLVHSGATLLPPVPPVPPPLAPLPPPPPTLLPLPQPTAK